MKVKKKSRHWLPKKIMELVNKSKDWLLKKLSLNNMYNFYYIYEFHYNVNYHENCMRNYSHLSSCPMDVGTRPHIIDFYRLFFMVEFFGQADWHRLKNIGEWNPMFECWENTHTHTPRSKKGKKYKTLNVRFCIVRISYLDPLYRQP